MNDLVLRPRNLDEAIKLADIMAKSDIVPKDFSGKPGNVLVAIQMGAELGLGPMQAMQNIAVINGRPTMWGDSVLALVQAHPDYQGHTETGDERSASCTIRRRGQEPYTVTFTMDMAKTAGLSGKPGPWQQYPRRMLQMRARSWALRDKFADALRGISVREEVEDYDTVATAPNGAEVQMPRRASNTPKPNGGAEEVPTPVRPPPVAHAESARIIYATEIEMNRLRAVMRGSRKKETDLIEFLSNRGVNDPAMVPAAIFEEAVEWAKKT